MSPPVVARTIIAPLIVLLTATLALSCAPQASRGAAASWSAGVTEHAIVAAGEDRRYLLQVPAARPRGRFGVTRAFPLVILLHGSGADGETIRRQSGIETLADSLHVVVAFPDGTNGRLGFGSDWNAGTCCGAAARGHVDDVAFIRGVITDVEAHLPIDARRVFVAGFSDGARMAYRMACDAAPLVAAIGVVSGSLRDEHCAPGRPVPVIAFHGTDDDDVPYDDDALTVWVTPPVPASSGLPPSVRFWSAVDACTGLAVQQVKPHVTRAQFSPCAGADVVLYTIDGGRHAWPGGEKDGSDGQEPTTELRATPLMLQFFLRHPRR